MGEDSRCTVELASLVMVISAILVLSCGVDKQTMTKITDAAKRFTPATAVGVSIYIRFIYVLYVCTKQLNAKHKCKIWSLSTNVCHY